ncbi:MAG TPA: MASE1 domain-containing protein [Candidatus Acidoferrum sp.]|nr:MASE1 domain-containing protein [Candidatus Acidoferrum sp.]
MSHPHTAFPFFRLRTAIDSLSETPVIASTIHPGAIGLLVALAYYAGSLIGFLLTPAGTPISTFWPPNAILLAAFLLTPSRIWWVLALAVLPAHLLVQLRAGIPLISALAWFVGNTGEALLGALCVRIFKKDKPLFESVYGVILFLAFGVFLPTFSTSFLDAAGAVLTGLGQNYWMLWTTRLTSNIVADLTIVPAIVIFGVKGVSWLRRASISAYSEAAALTAGTLIISLFVFGRESSISSFWAIVYAPLPLMIWALLRFGSGGASASLLAIALISFWNTMHGRGPLGMQSMVYAVLSLHFLLTVLAVSFMLSGALIAEQRRSEEALRTKCGNLVHAQEQERYRIARELHDNILQRLILLGLQLDELRAASLVFAKPPLNKVYDQISAISKAISDLSHGLHPFMLEYLGLPRALKKLCQDSGARCAITIDFSEHDLTSPLPSDVSGCLFRVAQEALQNIARHSRAKNAVMELRLADRAVLLRISDDGGGLDLKSIEDSGLTMMHEQLLVLRGSLNVTSMPSRGTLIELSIPLKDVPLIPGLD